MSVPKLRFKEFHEDWPKTSFQNLFIFKNGINASKEQYGSGTKFINVLDIINNPNGITYDSIIGSVQVSQKDIDKNLVNYGDVVFQRSSETREEVGQSNVYLSKEPVVFGGFVIRGSAQVPYDPLFMNGLLKTDKVRDQITQLSGGSTRFNIGQDSLNKVSIFLPSKEEQTKIATFLSVVDEKISQLSQKLHLLGQYKQGMMQKLFSQQIRFKADDGSEFGEWEKTTLGLTGKFIGGGTPSKEVTEFWQGSIPWISSSDLVDESIFNINITRYISTEALNQSATKLIPANSILIVSRVGVGKVAVTNRDICTSQDFTSLVLNNGNPVFFGYLIKSLTGRLLEMNQGTSIKGFVKDDLSNLKVEIPNLAEQTKIANFLSAIDQKIDVVSKQLDQAKLWKKGLLQQMFV
ncbi:restriction endonuclease subunit S [Acinetobacter guillouiae]|uniref:restriction endonuclease subunit S n=1 Tax=Acinetobacter TaxID=469 RepID=UPI003AF98000